ncbi:MAG: carboxypeptidase regulatory-like domain-containing protein, partial [Gemmatimonas sp.]
RVTANTRCSPRADRADALALLTQARAGLLTLVVAREANPARVTRLAFTRTMDATGTRIVRQRVRIDSAANQAVSFNAARTAGDFVRDGFRVRAGGQQTLYGPDADILLDDAFARGYCFHLAKADTARRNQIGLGFAPAGSRRGRVDIDGALWIDTVSRALIDIQFRYRGVEQLAEDLGAGGSITFRDVPNGVTMIDRWLLRVVGGADSSPAAAPGVVALQAIVVSEIGGELASASWGDSTSWTSPLGTLQLGLMHPDGSPAAGIGVGLQDTDYRAISDSAGRVILPELLPGPYKVFVVDPLLVPIGVVLPTPVEFNARRATTDILNFTVPTALTFVADVCGTPQRASGSASILARAMNDNGDPIANASWRLRKSTHSGWIVVADGGRTGTSGLIQRCTSLAIDDRIELQVWRDGGPEQRMVRQLRDPLTVVPVTLAPVVASRVATGGADSRRDLTLSGTVSDSVTGASISDARVSLVGTLQEAVTNSSGRFLLAGVARGDHTIEVGSPWLDSIGAVKRVNVFVSDNSSSLSLHVPSLSQIAMATCGASDVSGIVGRVVMRGAAALPKPVTVVVEWTEPLPATSRWLRTITDERGTYRLCGVPLNTALRLSTDPDSALGAGTAPLSVQVGAERRFARADITLDPSIVTGALFSGTIVVDGSTLPIANVEVLFPELSRSVTTNEQGSFRIRDIPPGTHVILVRGLGFSPLTAQVNFALNQSIEHRIALHRVQALKTVDVNAVNAPSSTFEEHRKLGLGRFLTRADLQRANGQQLGMVLSQVMGNGGMQRGRGAGAWPVGRRAPTHLLPKSGGAGGASCGTLPSAKPGAGQPCSFNKEGLRSQGYYCPEGGESLRGIVCACYSQVYVDDRLQNPGSPTEPFDVNTIPVSQVEGIEIYGSAAQTPGRYNSPNAVCGVYLIWTRRADE